MEPVKLGEAFAKLVPKGRRRPKAKTAASEMDGYSFVGTVKVPQGVCMILRERKNKKEAIITIEEGARDVVIENATFDMRGYPGAITISR